MLLKKYYFVFALFCTLVVSNNCTATLYEDAEDGDTLGDVPPNVRGWFVYDATPAGAVISNVYDADKDSRVIQFVGPGNTNNGYALGDWLPTSAGTWNNISEFNVHWCAKYSTNYVVYMRVYTTTPNASGSLQRYIYYTAVNSDNGLSTNGVYIHHGLGTDKSNGQWHTLNRNLQADLQEYEPGNQITSVTAYLIRGTGRVDDIHLTQAPMKPVINLKKTVKTIYDPINFLVNPKAIPGAILEYSLRAENLGFKKADSNTIVVNDDIPANTKVCVSNTGNCKAPYLVATGNTSGMSIGGVTYVIGGVDVTNPAADIDGYNSNVTSIKIAMNGEFLSACSGSPSFEVKFRTGIE